MPVVKNRWEHFAHGSDIGIRGIGESKARAFEAAALAMAAVVTEPGLIRPREQADIHCEGSSDEMIFYDWLNALIYEMSSRKMIFGRFEVVFKDQRLDGKAWGEKVNVVRHQPAVEIKAATFTELRVSRESDGSWRAQCVVDI